MASFAVLGGELTRLICDGFSFKEILKLTHIDSETRKNMSRYRSLWPLVLQTYKFALQFNYILIIIDVVERSPSIILRYDVGDNIMMILRKYSYDTFANALQAAGKYTQNYQYVGMCCLEFIYMARFHPQYVTKFIHHIKDYILTDAICVACQNNDKALFDTLYDYIVRKGINLYCDLTGFSHTMNTLIWILGNQCSKRGTWLYDKELIKYSDDKTSRIYMFRKLINHVCSPDIFSSIIASGLSYFIEDWLSTLPLDNAKFEKYGTHVLMGAIEVGDRKLFDTLYPKYLALFDESGGFDYLARPLRDLCTKCISFNRFEELDIIYPTFYPLKDVRRHHLDHGLTELFIEALLNNGQMFANLILRLTKLDNYMTINYAFVACAGCANGEDEHVRLRTMYDRIMHRRKRTLRYALIKASAYGSITGISFVLQLMNPTKDKRIINYAYKVFCRTDYRENYNSRILVNICRLFHVYGANLSDHHVKYASNI
jgi:hypothetical protein